MTLLTNYEIHKLFTAKGCLNRYPLDRTYRVTTERYIRDKAIPAYHMQKLDQLQRARQYAYVPQSYDCENWAIGLFDAIQTWYSRYYPDQQHGLAVGFGFHRTLNHALLIAVTKDSTLKLAAYETIPAGTLMAPVVTWSEVTLNWAQWDVVIL